MCVDLSWSWCHPMPSHTDFPNFLCWFYFYFFCVFISIYVLYVPAENWKRHIILEFMLSMCEHVSLLGIELRFSMSFSIFSYIFFFFVLCLSLSSTIRSPFPIFIYLYIKKTLTSEAAQQLKKWAQDCCLNIELIPAMFIGCLSCLNLGK